MSCWSREKHGGFVAGETIGRETAENRLKSFFPPPNPADIRRDEKVFGGRDIDVVGQLKPTLSEASIKSIVNKSIRTGHKKKRDKLKLKDSLLLYKLDLIYKKMKEMKKKMKPKGGRREVGSGSRPQEGADVHRQPLLLPGGGGELLVGRNINGEDEAVVAAAGGGGVRAMDEVQGRVRREEQKGTSKKRKMSRMVDVQSKKKSILDKVEEIKRCMRKALESKDDQGTMAQVSWCRFSQEQLGGQ